MNTEKVIVETFANRDYNSVPSVVVYSHGPFSWGKSPHEAVNNAVVLETVSEMAFHNFELSDGKIKPMQQEILDRHYLRKHGANAYYGQI